MKTKLIIEKKMLIYHKTSSRQDQERIDGGQCLRYCDMLLERNGATRPEVVIVMCSQSVLQWVSAPQKFKNSSARINGKKVLALLSAVVGSQNK